MNDVATRVVRRGMQVRGFTLVELLVVLVLVALLAGMALPSLLRLRESADRASAHNRILGLLAVLPYRAYISGKPMRLTDKPPFDLPQGWSLRVPEPIVYLFSGVCEGGSLVLVAPDGVEYSVRLAPPRCRPQG